MASTGAPPTTCLNCLPNALRSSLQPNPLTVPMFSLALRKPLVERLAIEIADRVERHQPNLA